MWDDREKIVQATWTSPVTNRLLLEAGLSSFNSRWGLYPGAGADQSIVSITELIDAPANGMSGAVLHLSLDGESARQRPAAQRVARVGVVCDRLRTA